ncbi:MAG: hypothetical protein M1824_003525 [Vezdaea acicularis]|nr:MAG: hypothetical protein M1824_003525 [Vezdaea acicularis]
MGLSGTEQNISALAKPELKEVMPKRWNTNNLGLRFGSDALSAACAAGGVVPIITLIDRAIFENASGRAPLMTSVLSSLKQILFRPYTFFFSKPFGLVFALYGSTYLTANTVDTLTSTVENLPSNTTTKGATKFFAASTVNMTICMFKDAKFAQLFGAASAPRSITKVSYALFAMRDSATVFASFNAPSMIAPNLPVSEAWEKSVMSRQSTAQIFAPAVMQLLSTPFHLLGIDIYNRPRGTQGVGWRERAQKVRKDYLTSTVARMCRIVPAFGIGGVVNLHVRQKLLLGLD